MFGLPSIYLEFKFGLGPPNSAYFLACYFWDPPTFRGFFGLIFPTKRTFEPTVLLLKKAARCHPFLAVFRCLFHNHLRLKRSSLLNVYLNCKFEISLLTSHLFFSLFNSECLFFHVTAVIYLLFVSRTHTYLRNCCQMSEGVG